MSILKALGGVVVAIIVLIAGVLVGARFADGPLEIIAGGPFVTGEKHTGAEPDWSFINNVNTVEFQLIDPDRSRTTWIVEHEGKIYIPSGYMTTWWGKIWKQWPIEVEKDGRAILRADGKLYDRQLVRITEGPELYPVVKKIAVKYLGADENAIADSPEAEVMAPVTSGYLWIFELAPR